MQRHMLQTVAAVDKVVTTWKWLRTVIHAVKLPGAAHIGKSDTVLVNEAAHNISSVEAEAGLRRSHLHVHGRSVR